MISLVLLLVVMVYLFSLARADCPDCDTCNVIDKVCVNKLSAAESICIDGQPVPPGNHNPCQVKDIDEEGNIIIADIPNCCAVDNDCIDLVQGCTTASCRIPEGKQRGQCVTEEIVNCCTVADDCPKLPCKTAVCDGVCDEQQGSFFTHSADSKHKNSYSKRTISFATPCTTCSYVDKPNCCIESIDCEKAHGGPCKQNEQGFCINSKCQCQQFCKEECTHQTQEVDCAYLEPKLEECELECASIECVHGYCKIVTNPNHDGDGDGHNCDEDCNDNDESVFDFVWCVDSSQNNDQDCFLQCGSEAVRRCGNCTESETEVDFVDLDCDPQNLPAGPCHLSRNCDCCDNSPSCERPDHTICCQADCDVEDPPVLDCGGDPRPVCVTKPATNQTMDEECFNWGKNTPDKDCDCTDTDCTNCWVAYTGEGMCPTEFCAPPVEKKKRSAPKTTATKKKKRQVQECDSCPGNSTSPTHNCLRDCDGDNSPVCPVDTESAIDCCVNLRSHGSDANPPLQYEFVDEQIKQCCQRIIAESDPLTASDPDNLFTDATDATVYPYTSAYCNFTSTPYIPNQCDCPDGYIDSDDLPEVPHQDYCDCTAGVPNDFLSICGTDADNDCTPACEPIRYCSTQSSAEITQDEVCALDGYVPFDAEAECDCAPEDAQFDKLHGCFPDHDHDGFLNCTDCLSTCGNCPPGRVPVPVDELPQAFVSLGAKLKEPLGRFRHDAVANRRHANHKRDTCDPPPAYKPCPCSEPVQEGEHCQDQPPPKLDSNLCDCCDSDPYAYPGSRFCSSKPRVCPDEETGEPSFDYNCDDDDDHKVVCEDTDEEDHPDDNDDIIHDTANGRDRYIRGCQEQNNSNTDQDGVFGGTQATTLGECRFNSTTHNCSTQHGFCLERKRNAGDLVKRAMGDGGLEVPAPIECNDGEIVDPEDYLPDPPPEGSCIEYIEECHPRPHMNPTGCHCDCDICVVVGQ